MHQLYFVILPEEIKTSEEAKAEARTQLDNNGFAGEGGYFTNCKADWYVTGGRWSGYLQETSLGIKFYDEVEKLIKPEDKFGFSNGEIEKNKTKIQSLWKKLGGKDKSPFHRDQYQSQGYEDDAMRITPKLLKALKKNKKGFEPKQLEVFDPEISEEINLSDLNKDHLKKWIVVIDYHN